jgi:hypothetical protein
MNKLDSFLKTLSDVELAKFIVYRYKDFVGTSKGTIISEAKTRNLNHLDIKRLYNQDVNYDDKIKNLAMERISN